MSCSQMKVRVPIYMNHFRIFSMDRQFLISIRYGNVVFDSNLHNYFNLHVCPSFRQRRRRPTLCFQFLQSYYKVSLIKVAWYVLRVKDMHSWSPPDLWGPWDEEKLSYIHYDIRREEAKLSILKLASVLLSPQCWSKAVVCISTPRMYPWSGHFLVSCKRIYSLNLWSLILKFYKLQINAKFKKPFKWAKR